MDSRWLAIPTAIVVLFGVVGCQVPAAAPNAPSAISERAQSRAQSPFVNGRVAVSSVSRDSGASIVLRECPLTGHQRSDALHLCTDQLGIVLEVEVDRDIPSAMLRVQFATDHHRCAAALTARRALTAGVPVRLDTSTVQFFRLVDQFEGAPSDLGCESPPVVTTRMVVEVLDLDYGYPGTPMLTSSFPYSYTFVAP